MPQAHPRDGRGDRRDDLLADDRSAAVRSRRSTSDVVGAAAARGRSACGGLSGRSADFSATPRRGPRPARRYLEAFVLERVGGMSEVRPEELLIDVLAGMLDGLGHVAVGAASPIPGAAALLARERSGGRHAGLGARQARATIRSPTAGASCSTARRRAGSTPSSSAAARSTARPTSTWSASAAIRRAGCAGRARSARPISTSWCRA